MYFHTDDPATINWLASVLMVAATNGDRVRFNVDSNGALSVKRAESIWSPPIPSTTDPYRDNSGS